MKMTAASARTVFAEKLGACSRCMRLCGLLLIISWAVVMLVWYYELPYLLKAITIVCALAISVLSASHALMFALRRAIARVPPTTFPQAADPRAATVSSSQPRSRGCNCG